MSERAPSPVGESVPTAPSSGGASAPSGDVAGSHAAARGAGWVRSGFLLPLADDALVLSHRLGEWAGWAPVLEEELALANTALDLLGQARTLYSELGDENELAFLREERSFVNCQLVERPNGDFAHTMVRQLLFSTWQELLYRELAGQADGHPGSPSGAAAQLAAKAVHEVAYHRDHAEQWVIRLGDGTAESHQRAERATAALWGYTGELFQPLEGLTLDWRALRREWTARISTALERATLSAPDTPQGGAWSAGAGRQGVHTESFGRMLAEMQHLHRSHPGATW